MVTGYEDLIDSLKLPDLEDRHVLAAAIRAGAQVIVTANLKHFPTEYLARFNIEAKLPDDFLLDQLASDTSGAPPGLARGVTGETAANYRMSAYMRKT
jgi:hypothetical protein